MKNLNYFDISYLRKIVPKHGLDIKIKGHNLSDYAREILDISYNSLKTYGLGEEKLLEPLKGLVDRGATPADIVIEKWHNEKFLSRK